MPTSSGASTTSMGRPSPPARRSSSATMASGPTSATRTPSSRLAATAPSATTRGTSLCNVALGFAFRQEQTGFNLQGDKSFATGSVEHRLIGGMDFMRTRTSESRDATVVNLTTGTTTRSLAGENFPVHDFPTGETRQTGVFAQDEMRFFDGRFTLTPGLRFDHYSLSPDGDDLVYTSAGGRPAVSSSIQQD